LTQSGAQRLIENTLKAKSVAKDWKVIAVVLADALAALDMRDIDVDVEPYKSAVQISELLRENKVLEVLKIIKCG
jgi:hypothetical protein